MLDLDGITGFEWDEKNREKNWEKHRVSAAECEEVFFSLPLILREDTGHSQGEPRFYVLGETGMGRQLFVVFTVRNDKIRVISARDLSRKERRIYEQADS